MFSFFDKSTLYLNNTIVLRQAASNIKTKKAINDYSSLKNITGSVNLCKTISWFLRKTWPQDCTSNKTPIQQTLRVILKCIVVLDQVDSVQQNKLLFQSAYLRSIGCLFTLLYLEMIKLSFKGVYIKETEMPLERSLQREVSAPGIHLEDPFLERCPFWEGG